MSLQVAVLALLLARRIGILQSWASIIISATLGTHQQKDVEQKNGAPHARFFPFLLRCEKIWTCGDCQVDDLPLTRDALLRCEKIGLAATASPLLEWSKAAPESRPPVRDATALRRGVSRLSLHKRPSQSRCHGLAPWSFTFVATQRPARSRCHGLAPWSFTFVATMKFSPTSLSIPGDFLSGATVAATVNLHGARPWHLRSRSRLRSGDREIPLREAVASRNWQPEQLVMVWERSTMEKFHQPTPNSPGLFLEWRERRDVFSDVAGCEDADISRRSRSFLTGGTEPERTAGVYASSNLFSLLRPQLRSARDLRRQPAL